MTHSLQTPFLSPNSPQTASSLTCGELLVQWLEYYGVETVFGIPGVHTVELYRGLPNTNIRHVTPRHEQGAGFMADGYYRASGKVGVCFIITGPGMTNIMTAMAQPQANKPLPHPAQLDLIVETLKTAKNPVLLYGGGCVDVNHDAQKLSELIDAPTFLTINAKGLLPPAHPLSLGSNQSLDAGRAVISEADLVLAIGTELGETDYDVFFNDGFKVNGTLIRIDCDAQQLQRPFRADIALLSDAQMAISGLCTRLENQPLHHQAAPRVAKVKQALIEEMTPDFAGQNALLQLIRDEVEDVIFVGDSTQPVYSGNLGFEALTTRRWFNSSTGFGTLGYGLPAAIGAMIGSKAPVISLMGDGGIQFTIAELICAAELELPLIVLLWNNQGYGEIRRYMQEGGLPLIGVNIKTPNFERLGAGFGAGYRRITDKQQLIEALKEDIKGKQPIIYEVDEADAFLLEMGKGFTCFS